MVWTLIHAVILGCIAIPTVRTIFRTQGKAPAGSLQVEVIGHQWWWEFKYPQYGITTANELYIPIGRKVNFAHTTNDVLHSFSVPQLGGKRALISNHTNHPWSSPDSHAEPARHWVCAAVSAASLAVCRPRRVAPRGLAGSVPGLPRAAGDAHAAPVRRPRAGAGHELPLLVRHIRRGRRNRAADVRHPGRNLGVGDFLVRDVDRRLRDAEHVHERGCGIPYLPLSQERRLERFAAKDHIAQRESRDRRGEFVLHQRIESAWHLVQHRHAGGHDQRTVRGRILRDRLAHCCASATA